MKRLLLILALLAPLMIAAPQYAGGTTVDTTVAADTAAILIAAVRDNLVTAGWTILSGSGTTDVVLQSASTPNSNSISVRIWANGSTASFYMRNSGGTKVTRAWNLNVATSKTYVFNACKYRFAMWPPGSTAGNEFLWVEVPYVPDLISASISGEFGILQSHTSSYCWRERMTGQYLSYAFLVGGTLSDQNDDGTASALVLLQTVPIQQATNAGYRWRNNTLMVTDAFPVVSEAQNTEAKIVGQLWQAIIVSEQYADGATISFDSHTWRAVTVSNSTARQTLFIMVS